MRYLTVRIQATDMGTFHPLGKRLAEEPSINREAIHHVELLADGTVLTLAEGSGDRERYEEIMNESPNVDEYLVSGEDRWIATTQFEANDPLQKVLGLRRMADLVIETPVKINDDGSVRITFLGTESDFQALYDRATGSSAFDTTIVETGAYDPDAASFMRVLTTRQQEILQVATEAGYYSNPRRATHEDIANTIGIAPTTVGDHLREIESKVFETLVR
ncbi:helix-turn-helix domain-containing protein [Halovenus halobia]|uniref:helix-turn-helix domain-containing protein n=1 Tax=Halovenus halobia TaxID=3396622 RepID=UPI003F54DB42